MKKIFATVFLLVGVVAAEITVPPGAVVLKKTEAITATAIIGIEVLKLEANLEPTNKSYVVTLKITDADGYKQKKTVKMSDGEASAIMAGAGYSLTNVLDAATAAIQAVINQQFEGKQ
jgi:hypothetical protein